MSYNVQQTTLERRVELVRPNENQVQNVKVALGLIETVLHQKRKDNF